MLESKIKLSSRCLSYKNKPLFVFQRFKHKYLVSFCCVQTVCGLPVIATLYQQTLTLRLHLALFVSEIEGTSLNLAA